MKGRVLIGELGKHVGETVTIAGWVDVRRDQGKMVFFDFRDRSGVVQGVVLPKSEALEAAKEVRQECVVEVDGIVNKRPEKNVVEKLNGDIELEITAIRILSKAEEIPFEKNSELNIDTRFDYRPFTLRSERDRDIFAVQATILEAYRSSLQKQGFTEFIAPALVGGDAEGGSAVFKVSYFEGQTAYLATSPQLYKQMMVGVYERVFTFAKIFRAEKSATTRHLSELTQMDFEMGFIKDEYDVMAVLETVIRDTVMEVLEKHAEVFVKLNVPLPKAEKPFPSLTLEEALKTIGAPDADDLEPEQERALCEWALKEHGSDFVFVTKFPTKARAFYTMSDEGTNGKSRGFDLLFRGLEINSGAQRIHDHDALVERIKERGMDPEKFRFYLQAFKYGMPPHGGCSTGLERLTMKMLNLGNAKEASAFPRDMHRIDIRLTESE
jgi:nondiscriminating aspartyl-tRNA synthetase